MVVTRFGRASLLVLLIGLAADGWGASREFTVPLVATGPELTGDLSDPVWQQAARLTDFVALDEGASPEARTEVYVLADAEALYVAFLCHEPNMDQLVSETSGHGGPVPGDDCVHVVIDPARGGVWAWHWAANSIGAVWNALETPSRTQREVVSRPEGSGSRRADGWVRELRFPFDALGAHPQPGEVWGMNFGRSRRAGKEEHSSWAPTLSGLADPETFGEASFAPAPGPVHLEVLSRGGCSADGNDDGRNTFRLRARNDAARPVKLALSIAADGVSLSAREMVLEPGLASLPALRYRVPDEDQPRLEFQVLADGEALYASELAAAPARPRGPQVWQVADPLYEELLSADAPGWRREGALVWGHLNDVSLLRDAARRFAIAYSEAAAYQEHVDHGFILFGHGVVRDLDHPHPIARYRVRNAATTVTRAPEGVPWLLDPRALARAVADIQDVFDGPHPLVFGISAGDEVADYMIKQGADLARKAGDYEYLAEADAEVREQFGGGQWGIPEGLAERDPNPLQVDRLPAVGERPAARAQPADA